MTDPLFKPVLFVPWGDGETEIEPRFEPATQYSFMPEPDKRLKSVPVSMRLDEEGGIHLLNGQGSAISTFSPNGDFIRKTTLESLKDATIIDFFPDSKGFIVLSRRDYNFNLQKVNNSGIALWDRNIENEIPSPDHLTFSNGKLYIFSESDIDILIEISIHNGETSAVKKMPEGILRPFGTSSGELIGTIFFPDLRRRGITIYSPGYQTQTKTVSKKELYGPLTSSIGADNEKNLYLFGFNDSISASEIYKINSKGNLLKSIPLPIIYARNADTLFTITIARDKLRLEQSGSLEKEQLIPLPEEIRPYLAAQMSIVRLDKNNLVLDLVKKDYSFERRVFVGFDGKLIKEVATREGEVVNSIPSYKNWAVSGDGTIFFPVCGESGIVVVKVKL